MIKVKFNNDWRVFRGGETISISKNPTFVVGENGIGKSSLARVIAAGNSTFADVQFPSGYDKCFFFDFEYDSPRTRPVSQMDKDQLVVAIQASKVSHGESNNLLLQELEQAENCLVVLDEPESGLSIKSCQELFNLIQCAVNNNCFAVIFTHSPVLIHLAEEVFDLNQKRFVKSHDYLSLQWPAYPDFACS